MCCIPNNDVCCVVTASKSGDTPWSAREVVQALKQWLPASQLPLLQLVLQVHEKSPRVEMLRSVGQQTRSLLFGDAQEGPAHFVVWVGAQQSSIHVLETASQVQAAPEKLPKPIPDLSQEMVQLSRSTPALLHPCPAVKMIPSCDGDIVLMRM